MNFVDQSDAGFLDSGDCIDCISTGIRTARSLLHVIDADMSVSDAPRTAFGNEAEALREWMKASIRLLDATEDEEIETCYECGSEIPAASGRDNRNKHHAITCRLWMRHGSRK